MRNPTSFYDTILPKKKKGKEPKCNKIYYFILEPNSNFRKNFEL